MAEQDQLAEQQIERTLTNLDIHMQLLELAEGVRPLPTTVVRLASLVADEECDLEHVDAVLREDPAVVADLLKEANSAASAPVNPIVTARAALTRLGLARVLAIAVSFGMGGQMDDPLVAYQLPSGALQSHMTRSSYVAEAIRALSPGAAGPEVVTAALLHHVGQLVLDKFLDAKFFSLALEHGIPIVEAERELTEVDHAELGALMLEAWDIPTQITEAVRHHHTPWMAEGPDAHIVCLASLIADEIGNPDHERSEAAEALFAQSVEALEIEEAKVFQRATTMLDRAGLLLGEG